MTSIPTARQTPGAVSQVTDRGTSMRYWICLGLLVVAAALVRLGPGLIGAYFQKEPVPLKRPLAQFDTSRLGPRYQRHPASDGLPPMSEDMLESLGTHEYLQVFLRDTQKPVSDPARVARLFVTYYTGQPDMVPHTPDQCYQAGGYDSLGGAYNSAVPVPGIGAPRDEVPVRVVRFLAPARRSGGREVSPEVTVLYLFSANGGYSTTRDGVRMRLSNLFVRYAYYAKIEVSFTDESTGASAGTDDCLRALSPLLEAVLPVLYEDHFDLSKFSGAAPGGAR